jgi:hypothetical protein
MIDSDYFENVKGRGILATADADGRVDAAVFFSIDKELPLVGAGEG